MYDFDRMNLHECWKSNRYIAILAHNDGQALAEHEIDFHEFTVHLVRMLDDMIFRQWRQPLADVVSTRTYSKDGRVIFKIVNEIVERG